MMYATKKFVFYIIMLLITALKWHEALHDKAARLHCLSSDVAQYATDHQIFWNEQ